MNACKKKSWPFKKTLGVPHLFCPVPFATQEPAFNPILTAGSKVAKGTLAPKSILIKIHLNINNNH